MFLFPVDTDSSDFFFLLFAWEKLLNLRKLGDAGELKQLLLCLPFNLVLWGLKIQRGYRRPRRNWTMVWGWGWVSIVLRGWMF